MQIMKKFQVAPFDQHLTCNGRDLNDNQATLASLRIYPGTVIILKVSCRDRVCRFARQRNNGWSVGSRRRVRDELRRARGEAPGTYLLFWSPDSSRSQLLTRVEQVVARAPKKSLTRR